MENKKEVLLLSAYLGGYPGPERSQEYFLFGKLYQEGYVHVREGDEALLFVSKEELPSEDDFNYFLDYEDVVSNLQHRGWTVVDEFPDDFLPEGYRPKA